MKLDVGNSAAKGGCECKVIETKWFSESGLRETLPSSVRLYR
jgi:hypothetical protein